MKLPLTSIKLLVILTTQSFLIGGCQTHSSHDNSEHEGVNELLDKRTVDSIDYMVSSDIVLEELKSVLVDIPESELKFYVPERTSAIRSFPCGNCHTKSIDRLKNEPVTNGKNAHWDINMKHAGTKVMDCITCHDQNDLDQLVTITGKPLSIDHSFQLCGQCHSSQYQDWLGGAHGKRLGGWAPPRTVNSCVNCHNPHQPAFTSRWPARLNTVKLKEQDGNR